MKLHEIMTTKPHMISSEETLVDAANKMRLYGCGILPVGTTQIIEGVLTDRDIVVRAIANKKDPQKTQVKDIMTTDLCFGYEDENLGDALKKMQEKNIKRVLVLNENKILVGILSMHDIFSRIEDQEILDELLNEPEVSY